MAAATTTNMHFVDKSFCPDFLRSLSKLRQSEKLTDVTLKADGVLLPCHRVVLSAASPYFNAMFTSGFDESASPTVEMKSTDHATLQSIVDYVYSAEIDITLENVQNLAQASNEFQFEELKKACGKFMLQHIDPGNCIGFYKFAEPFGLKLLAEKGRTVMLREFKSIVNGAEFKELTEAELVDYISDSDLVVPNEDAVFEAVTLWVNFDLRARRAAFKRVLAHVRMSYCSNSYIYRVVKNHKLMSTQGCQKYLEEAQMFQLFPDRRHEVDNQRAYLRKSFGVQHRLVLVGGYKKPHTINPNCWYFDEDTAAWKVLAQVPQAGPKQFYSVVCHAKRHTPHRWF
jgi:hypothetical protein